MYADILQVIQNSCKLLHETGSADPTEAPPVFYARAVDAIARCSCSLFSSRLMRKAGHISLNWYGLPVGLSGYLCALLRLVRMTVAVRSTMPSARIPVHRAKSASSPVLGIFLLMIVPPSQQRSVTSAYTPTFTYLI